jgi:predicted protein tyrosine phosphatase
LALANHELEWITAVDRTTVAEGVSCPAPYVVISIRDPGTPRIQFGNRVGLRDVLFTAFHDAEPASGSQLPKTIRLLTRRQALRLARFVWTHRNKVRSIVCHCEQGMSRSPAVALAISEVLGIETSADLKWTQPNQYVYELVRQALIETRPSVRPQLVR